MRLKSSFCTIAYRHTDKDIKTILREIKDCGYDGAEVWGNHLESLSKIEMLDLKDYAKSIELALPIASFYLGNFNLPMDNLEEMLQKTIFACEAATLIGASKLRSFAGWTCECSSLTASEEYWDFNIQGFKAMQAHIEKANLELVFETHYATLVDSIQGVEKLLGAVGSPNYKINLQIDDIGPNSNLNSPLEVYRALNKAGYPIAHMHMKKSLKEEEMPGYIELFQSMSDDQFDGYISIEHCSADSDPQEAAQEGLALQHKLFPVVQ